MHYNALPAKIVEMTLTQEYWTNVYKYVQESAQKQEILIICSKTIMLFGTQRL